MILGVHTDSGNSLDLVGIAAIITAITGIAVVIVQQRGSHKRLRTIETAVNHADEEISTDGPVTLGQRVKQVQEEARASSRVNLREHEMLHEVLMAHGEKIVGIERDLSSTKTQVEEHDTWERERAGEFERALHVASAERKDIATASEERQASTVANDSSTPPRK